MNNELNKSENLKSLDLDSVLKATRHRQIELVGQVGRNQGLPTFTGRLTLEQFADLTVVHNRRWAEAAGETFDSVTQREIIDAHANGLAIFMLQGLVAATLLRKEGSDFGDEVVHELDQIQDKIGRSSHYGLPQVTLVLTTAPDFAEISSVPASTAVKLFLPAGTLFVVADGQHRREAARRVRELLSRIVTDRRIPKNSKIFSAPGEPMSAIELDAWIAIQDTFRSWTMISFEAHVGLSVDQARQMFTNYNCNVKPVRLDLNLVFDQSNPLNRFAKEWVQTEIATHSGGTPVLDLRQLASIHGFLFLGKTSIKTAPYNVADSITVAKEFWTTILSSAEWKRTGSLIREVPVLKALAKAWFYVFLARRNGKLAKASHLRSYIRTTVFDVEWVESIPGLKSHTVPAETEVGFRFSPAHNDIVGRIISKVLE